MVGRGRWNGGVGQGNRLQRSAHSVHCAPFKPLHTCVNYNSFFKFFFLFSLSYELLETNFKLVDFFWQKSLLVILLAVPFTGWLLKTLSRLVNPSTGAHVIAECRHPVARVWHSKIQFFLFSFSFPFPAPFSKRKTQRPFRTAMRPSNHNCSSATLYRPASSAENHFAYISIK